jgi:hypothetical protein
VTRTGSCTKTRASRFPFFESGRLFWLKANG